MATWILLAIDGTQSDEWRRSDGSNSHVWKFHRDFEVPANHKRYVDGPDSTLGRDVAQIRAAALGWLLQTLAPIQPPERSGLACIVPSSTLKICLVGHSRGGLIAIEIARELSRHSYPVHFLALYDAVDMALGADGAVIGNVQTTYHAVRDPALGSRSSWGNTGRQNSGVYHELKFLTTHGGIGGDVVLQPSGLTTDFGCDTRGLRAGIMRALGTDLGHLCTTNSVAADRWVRAGARAAGLPLLAR